MIESPITLVLVLITVLVSLAGFRNDALIDKTILWPARMRGPEEYYRFLSSGFIHQECGTPVLQHVHALLYRRFGRANLHRVWTVFLYPVLYLAGIVVASLPSFVKHRNDGSYRSLGASGGVAAVLFSLGVLRAVGQAPDLLYQRTEHSFRGTVSRLLGLHGQAWRR